MCWEIKKARVVETSRIFEIDHAIAKFKAAVKHGHIISIVQDREGWEITYTPETPMPEAECADN